MLSIDNILYGNEDDTETSWRTTAYMSGSEGPGDDDTDDDVGEEEEDFENDSEV